MTHTPGTDPNTTRRDLAPPPPMAPLAPMPGTPIFDELMTERGGFPGTTPPPAARRKPAKGAARPAARKGAPKARRAPKSAARTTGPADGGGGQDPA